MTLDSILTSILLMARPPPLFRSSREDEPKPTEAPEQTGSPISRSVFPYDSGGAEGRCTEARGT